MRPNIACKVCGAEFAQADIEDVQGCPSCGTTTSPMWLQPCTVTLNWSDLRTLANWAEGWRRTKFPTDHEAERALGRILDVFRAVRPDGAPALTLVEEVREIPRGVVFVGGEDEEGDEHGPKQEE